MQSRYLPSEMIEKGELDIISMTIDQDLESSDPECCSTSVINIWIRNIGDKPVDISFINGNFVTCISESLQVKPSDLTSEYFRIDPNQEYDMKLKVFHRSRHNIFCPGAKLLFTIQDVVNSLKYQLEYVFNMTHRNGLNFASPNMRGRPSWELINSELIPLKVFVSSKNYEGADNMSSNTNIEIERIEAFEEKLGIRLENLSASVDYEYNNVEIFGEINEIDSQPESRDFSIKAIIFSEQGQIMGCDDTYISDFEGYDAFKLNVDITKGGEKVNRIRVYVKK